MKDRYAIELNTPGYPLPAYLTCLREQKVTHVIHDMQGIISVLDQALMPGILSSDICLMCLPAEARSLSGDPGLGLLEVMRRCVDEQKELHILLDFAHNVGDGSTEFLTALLTMLDPDLARLSPIKRRNAA